MNINDKHYDKDTKIIDLSSNKILVIPKEIGQLTKLLNLNLSFNKI